VGILLSGVGVITIGFGIRFHEISLGDTLITSGTTALTGGLILIGLAAAVSQLGRIADGLRSRSVPRPAQPRGAAEVPAREAQVREAPAREPRLAEPRPDAAADVSASAIERLRSSIPRPEKLVPEPEEVPLSPSPAQPAGDAEARSATAADENKGPRLDFLFRSKPAARQAEPEPFDALWPKRPRDVAPTPAAGVAPSPLPPGAAEPPSAQERREPVSDEAPSVAILKSGVVDGMAYTLYADGSIEAQLPQGTVRFGSIAELRAHIDNNS
jgi:hypothetical protein